MIRQHSDSLAVSVERIFQFSLLGLVAGGFLALAGSGSLDLPTLILTPLGLLARWLMTAGVIPFRPTARHASVAAIVYLAFLPADYYLLSRDFLSATVHAVCFLAVTRVLTARTGRDYAFTGFIAFVELIAAALLSLQSSFIFYLILCAIFAIAALTSGEIHRSLGRAVERGDRVQGPEGGRLPARLGLSVAAIALGATVAIGVMTLALFFAVPRTAQASARMFPNARRLTGFNSVVDLGGYGAIAKDDRPVMHIRSYPHQLPPDIRWRGAALSRFDGKRWSEPSAAGTEIPAAPGIAVVAARPQLSRRDGKRLLYSVEMAGAGTGTLFFAGIPEFVNIDTRVIVGTREGAFRAPLAPRETLRYQVSAFLGPRLHDSLTPSERAHYLQFPALDVRIPALARQWADEGNAGDPGELQRARRIEHHLQNDFRYVLDGPAQPVADPLADFLFVRREGYCEYFASAMAVMLRTIGIPARVATGFQPGFFNRVTGLYVVRASDAHAWVEAYVPPAEGAEPAWTTFDPTPVATSGASGNPSPLAMYLEAADSAWRDWVLSYDPTRQAVAVAQFENAWRRVFGPEGRNGARWWHSLRDPGRSPGTLAALAAALAAATALWICGPGLWKKWTARTRAKKIMRAGGSAAASLLYGQMLERLARRGFRRPESATPREFAAQLPAPEARLAAQFTEIYNRSRYGGETAAERLAALLQEFDAAWRGSR